MFLSALHSFISVLYSVFLSYTLEGAVCNPYSVNYPNLLITRGQRGLVHYTKRKKVCVNEYSTSPARYQGTKLRFFV